MAHREIRRVGRSETRFLGDWAVALISGCLVVIKLGQFPIGHAIFQPIRCCEGEYKVQCLSRDIYSL